MNSELRLADIESLTLRHGRLVVCLVVQAQGSVPRQAGARMAVLADGTTLGTIGGGLFESHVAADALAALNAGKSELKKYDFREVGSSPEAFGAVCGGWAEIFLEVTALPDELVIVGGGHCGRALARAASLLGCFQVTLLDDRPGFAEGAGLPDDVCVIPADASFSGLGERVSARSYVALVSRGFATDEAALREIVGSDAPYIGMMGSRRKVRVVLDNMRGDGFSAELLARVHAPIGLGIGAETPAEIAISILAQIIGVRAGVSTAKGK